MSTASVSIYLDHAATTPLRREVAEAMAECSRRDFGNPSSAHRWGRAARARLEAARRAVAAALGDPSARVVFTRGGTESDNLAVLGMARRWLAERGTAHLVLSAIEHPAVRAAADQAVREGARMTIAGFVAGAFDLDALRAALAEGPCVVSCMWVNNETGLALPISDVAALCRAHGALLHSDAVQAVGKVPVSLSDTPVDLLSVTGHKIGGPRGTGALIVRGPAAPVPLHFGGGQEEGMRPGTEDVAGAAGLAMALELALAERVAEARRLEALRDGVERRLLEGQRRLRVHASALPRAPHILSLGIPGADPDTLLAALDGLGIAASAGAACASGSHGASPAIAALHPDDDEDAAALRLSFGRTSTERDTDDIVAAVNTAIDRARALRS